MFLDQIKLEIITFEKVQESQKYGKKNRSEKGELERKYWQNV